MRIIIDTLPESPEHWGWGILDDSGALIAGSHSDDKLDWLTAFNNARSAFELHARQQLRRFMLPTPKKPLDLQPAQD